jgi:hypothetical protein
MGLKMALEMENKYIGVKNPNIDSPGSNMGLIFVLQEDGMYHCVNPEVKHPFVLTEQQIKHDLNLGYIKAVNE